MTAPGATAGRTQTRAFVLVGLTGALLAVGCKKATDVPESGALLLRITTPPQAPAPDELRTWVYDAGGSLFANARFPASGALPVPGPNGDIGTILLQPGSSAGALRVHVRGLRAGARVSDAVLVIPADKRGTTIAVALAADAPDDADGDDVPDAIDDCPTADDPAQTGCPDRTDAGGDASADAGADAATDRGDGGGPAIDAGHGDDAHPGDDTGTAGDGGLDDRRPADAGAMDARPDAAASDAGDASDGAARDGAVAASDAVSDAAGDGAPKQVGAVCALGTECSTGYCADRVCCTTACDQPCQQCVAGICILVRSAQDVPECSGGMSCNGAGRCM